MIIETIDTNGNERIINMAFITHITITTVGNPTGHPCCGEKGDTMIRISMAHSAEWIQVVCDHDGDDVTEGVLGCYKSWGYRGTNARGE
jgi:hypothetical protein